MMNNMRQIIAQTPLAEPLDGQEMMVILQGSYLVTTPLQKAAEAAVKTYAATITQSGTAAPVARVAANTVGLPIWSRVDATHYRLILAGAFPADRTYFAQGVDISGNYLKWIDAHTIELFCAGGNGTMANYPVKIEVYWYLITDVPTNLAALVISDSEIDLTWDTGADNYILESSFDNSSWVPIYDGAGGAFNDTGLQADTEYFYRLKAQTFGELDSDWVTTSATTDPAP